MDKIASFKVDHLTLKSGLYVSRKDKSGDVTATTFDLRFITPYEDEFIPVPAMHTVEHLGATFMRNGAKSSEVVYFGPMGCQTGFYLVMFGDLKAEDVFSDVIAMCDFIIGFSGEIPGAKKEECGNYLSHDLEGAKASALKYKRELLEYKRTEY